MADKTTGELQAVAVGDLPIAPDIYDDTLIPVEQQGDAKHITGKQFKGYAVSASKVFAESAAADASTAAAAKDAALSALQGVKAALDNLPEGDTLIINDLTTGGASAALSAEMGKLLGRRPNRTFVDNGYFANPVNQRGKTEYAGAMYTIDRWLSGNARGTLTVDGDGVTFSANSDGSAYFRQIIDVDFDSLSGRAVSLTIYFNNGVDQLITLTGTVPTESGEATIVSRNIGGGTLSLVVTAGGGIVVQLGRYAGYSIKIYAIKLELGSTQTLAHQDADGNWVLNEIPDYGEELRKCQRYCVELTSPDDNYGVLGSGIAASATLCRVYVPLPVSLRCRPAVTFSSSVFLALRTPASDKIEVTAMTVDHYSANMVILNCTVASGLTAGTRYDLWQIADRSVSVLLSSDL